MGTARGFAVMPGNFDCPEATDSYQTLVRRSSIRRNFNPYVATAAASAPARGGGGLIMEDYSSPERSSNVGPNDMASLRRRISDMRRAAMQEPVTGRTPAEVAAAASARARWVRNSATRGGRSRLHRHRLQRRNEDDSLGTVQDAVDRLNEANSDLTSILDEPLPQILSPDDFMAVVPDTELLEMRHKRRKLDSDALDKELPPKYGYYGQVVPGRLDMSLQYCDGGYLTERDEHCLHRDYSPENILRNDKSVYRTEKDYCSLILKHWKETPFSITKVVIKTPNMGFPAPVQEGLVFVSMSVNGLISGTRPYYISKTPCESPATATPEPFTPYFDGGIEPNSSARYANVQTSLQTRAEGNSRPPSRRHHHSSRAVATPRMAPDAPQHSFWATLFDDSNAQEREASSPEEYHSHSFVGQDPSTATDPTEFAITATCDDPSDDDEEATSPAILLDRQRRRHLGLDWLSSDDETDSSARRHRQLQSHPREIKVARDGNEADDVLVPHARFFIEPKKHVVSIKFDPPVSGRFVLVKMWSPENRDNIDMQSILIYGYAGTRYVPAIKLQ